MCRGGASGGNGERRSSFSVSRSFSSRRSTSAPNHGPAYAGDSAANHISQSSRRWYGANWRGQRRGSPGLPLNSYSRQPESSRGTSSAVPSRTTS